MFTASQKSTEMAFYEAIRQNAVERIAQIKADGQPTQQLQILTEIMNLRQAACNVQLVNKNLHIPSSKLQLFAETVQELLDNGHKALVFSQFVGHLRLIEQQVIKMGISLD
jgi:SNF2 family DNA or RNA helicase